MDPFEQQIEMMDIIFTQYLHTLTNCRMIKQCHKKCIPKTFADGELNKGEAVCAKRCGTKLLAAVELIGLELAAQQQAGGAGPLK